MNRNLLKLFVLPILISAVYFFSACTKKGETPQTGAAATGNEILFGEYGSMTGSESTFGVSTHKGVMMVVDEVNKAGGIKGRPIKVISYDDQGRADEAVTAITKLITQDRVMAIIGEVASSRSIAAGVVAQQYKIPMVSPSSTNPKVTQLGDYIFRVCFIDPFQGSVMAKFAMQNLKLTKAAIFRDIKSDYSVGLANFFTEDFKKQGGKVLLDISYSGGDVDFKSQLTKIKSVKPEILFVPGYYTEVGLIARQAKEQGMNAVLLGGDGWDSPDEITKIAGDAINNSYFSNHYSHEDKNPVVQNFVALYKAKYGEVPSGLAAMGYDAAAVIVDALKRSPEISSQALRDSLAQTKNFQGVTGIITINENRDAVKPAVVLKIDQGKFTYVTTINP